MPAIARVRVLAIIAATAGVAIATACGTDLVIDADGPGSADPDGSGTDAMVDGSTSNDGVAPGEGGKNEDSGKPCNERPQIWESPREMTELGAGVAYPYLVPNGLTLYATRNTTGTTYEVVTAQRPQSGALFGAASLVNGLTGPSVPTFPAQAIIGEIFTSQDDIYRTTFADGGVTVGVAGATNSGFAERAAALTADGKLLLFVKPAGGIIIQLERAAVDTAAFSTSRDVLAVGGTLLPAGYSFAITADGLGLYYTASGNAPDVMYTARQATSVAFPAGTPLPSLAAPAPAFETYARSVSADGCELYLASSRGTGNMRAFVAHRQ